MNQIAAKYRDFFTNSENISVYPANIFIAENAALFRAEYNLKTPDAIQLATAKNCGVDYIITNDKEWKKISNMEIILLDEIE